MAGFVLAFSILSPSPDSETNLIIKMIYPFMPALRATEITWTWNYMARMCARIQKGVQRGSEEDSPEAGCGRGGNTGHLPMPRSLWSGSACNRYPIPRSSRAMPWNGAIFHLAHISRSNSRAASRPTAICPIRTIALYSRPFVKHPQDHADRWHNAVTRFDVPRVFSLFMLPRTEIVSTVLPVPEDRTEHNQSVSRTFYWNLIIGNCHC